MKILFICSCLEPNKDGVGDYTQYLADELEATGNKIILIAINDSYIHEPMFQNRNCLRISNNLNWKAKVQIIKDVIENFNPDWVSLQFVIYGYHQKGLPFRLSNIFKEVQLGYNWHIMFHELWVGISKKSPINHKFYGYFQRKIILNLIEVICPQLCQTSNLLYQKILNENNIEANVLNLFSNIKKVNIEQNSHANILDKLNPKLNTQQKIKVGIFGGLHFENNFLKIFEILNAKYQKKDILLVVFGKSNEQNLAKLLVEAENHEKIEIVSLGMLSAFQISILLQNLTSAISMTPVQHLGKSGVYAAFKNHSLEVHFPFQDIVPEYFQIIESQKKQLESYSSSAWSVETVAQKFLDQLRLQYHPGNQFEHKFKLH